MTERLSDTPYSEEDNQTTSDTSTFEGVKNVLKAYGKFGHDKIHLITVAELDKTIIPQEIELLEKLRVISLQNVQEMHLGTQKRLFDSAHSS